MTEEIKGYVDGIGRKGDCPTVTIVMKPIQVGDIPMFTWTIGEKVKVIRNERTLDIRRRKKRDRYEAPFNS